MLGRRYQLERELGRGAGGAVYRGWDLRNGGLIAKRPAARFPSTTAFAGEIRDVAAALQLARPARAR